MGNLRKYPLMILFAVFIFGGFVVDALNPPKEFSEMENRYLQQAPPFSWRGLLDNSYSMKYETFINDQFKGRDGWITIKSVSEAVLGKIENNGIVYGKDTQMFEKNLTINTERVQSNTQHVATLKELYPDLSINFMMIPSAYEILTNKTPAGLGNIDQLAIIKDIYAQMTQKGINTIDVATALAEHQEEYIYYRTDHHWTTLGAYYGYKAVCDKLGLVPQPLDGLTKHSVEEFYGSHYSKAKLFNTVPDTLDWYDVPVTEVSIDGKPVDSIYDLSKVDKRDKYELFMRGNNGLTVIKTAESPDKKGNILIIKDSYANSMIPFLTANYNTITVVDLRSAASPISELLRSGNYDDLLVMYSFNNFTSDVNIAKIKY